MAEAPGEQKNVSGDITPLDPLTRDQGIVRTSIVGIIANVFLATFKAIVGMLSNSIAIVLDAVNNLSDAASSVITIVGTKLASKRPDRKHPYGYGRIEYLTTIIIAVIVLWAGITSLEESVGRIISPEPASYDVLTLAIVAVAVAAKIVLGLYTKRAGTKYKSGSLVASGTDALMDSIISAATLVAAVFFILTGVSLEAWLGAIIAVVIIKAGFDMLREVVSKILGEREDAEITRAIKQTVASVPGVLGAYDLLLEDYGPDRLWGSIHIEVSESMSASEIDALSRQIQNLVYIQHQVILHTIGVYARNEAGGLPVEIRSKVISLVQNDGLILELHGFYCDEDAKAVRFDLVVSFDAEDRSAVVARVKRELREAYPEYSFTITLDSDISD